MEAKNLMGADILNKAAQTPEGSKDVVPKTANGCTVVDVFRDGAKLVVVLESDSIMKLMSLPAKHLAFEQRLKHGLAGAGIDSGSGTYVPPEEYKAAKKEDRNVSKWRLNYNITPGL